MYFKLFLLTSILLYSSLYAQISPCNSSSNCQFALNSLEIKYHSLPLFTQNAVSLTIGDIVPSTFEGLPFNYYSGLVSADCISANSADICNSNSPPMKSYFRPNYIDLEANYIYESSYMASSKHVLECPSSALSNISCSKNGFNPNKVRLTFNDSTTLININNAIKNITYSNPSPRPDTIINIVLNIDVPGDPPQYSFPIPGFTRRAGGNNHWYKLSTSSKTFDAAITDCTNQGGYLVRIGSASEANFVRGLSGYGSYRFIGLTDQATEGRFVYVGTNTIGYTNWYSGEPNNAGNEDAVFLHSDGGMNDVTTSTSGKYTCEFNQEPRNTGQIDVPGNRALSNSTAVISFMFYSKNTPPTFMAPF